MDNRNITIAFSGHNIKEFAVAAIESFLLYYPDLRHNIIYFDDNSTDNTRVELEDREICVITWSEKYQKEYKDLCESSKEYNSVHYLSTRVCFIMRQIMERTQTEYLLINDGDVIFLQGGFLEKYMVQMKEKKYVVNSIQMVKAPLVKRELLKLMYYSPNQFRRFFENCCIRDEYILSNRIHLMHVFMNIRYLKEKSILGDSIDNEVMQMMNGTIADTGSDFYIQIQEKNISLAQLKAEYVNSILFHWGWLSSRNRDLLKDNNNSNRDFYREILTETKKDKIKQVLEQIDILPEMLLEHYDNTNCKSDFIEK